MTCPFYGKHDTGLGVLLPTRGNQCAVVRIAYAPCLMEIMEFTPDWAACPFSYGALPGDEEPPGCITRCVGCHGSSHVCRSPPECLTRAEGLCPECLRRAELLAAEASGQQRLIP